MSNTRDAELDKIVFCNIRQQFQRNVVIVKSLLVLYKTELVQPLGDCHRPSSHSDLTF